MTKKQKIWLWIFIVMFALPEILFLNILSFFSIFLNIKIVNLMSLIRGQNYFLNPIEFFIIIGIEIIGVLGSLGICVKRKYNILAVIFVVILFVLLSFFILIYKLSNMNWLM